MKTSRWMDANTHTHTHTHTHTRTLSSNISTKQTLFWETRIANAVIKRMVSNRSIFIPFNLKESVINMFHADNSEWLEDTPNGEKTSHLLQLSVFQSCNNEKCEPVIFDSYLKFSND